MSIYIVHFDGYTPEKIYCTSLSVTSEPLLNRLANVSVNQRKKPILRKGMNTQQDWREEIEERSHLPLSSSPYFF